MPNERSTKTNIEETGSTQDSQTSDQGSESFSSVHVQEQLGPVLPAEETRNDVKHDTINAQTPSRTSSILNPVFPKSNKKRTHIRKKMR